MKALFMRKMLPGRQSRRNNWRILPCLLVFVACIFSLSLCGNRCLKAQESEVISEGEFVFDSLNGMIKEYLGEGGGEVVIPAEIKGSPEIQSSKVLGSNYPRKCSFPDRELWQEKPAPHTADCFQKLHRRWF